MKTSEIAAPRVVGQIERRRGRAVATNNVRCLVLSANRARRNMLLDATSQSGWDTSVFATAAAVKAAVSRDVYHFAVIDLDLHGQTPDGFRELVSQLANNHRQILLGICGHEADPMEEIWVRQLGIWLYLPGSTNSSEISLLCEQALLVVERQQRQTSVV